MNSTTLAPETAQHPVVSREDWIAARKKLLKQEKALSQQIDAVSAARRALPWVKVDKEYVFDTPTGKQTLSDLFGKNSQLFVYHFMFGPDAEEGCPGCSFISDHIDGANLHLAHHDVSVVAVSRAPRAKFEPYKKRMGWHFKWVSSEGSDFNYDYHATARDNEAGPGKIYYNFDVIEEEGGEHHGISVFYKNEAGDIYHTYSTYARGGDILIGAHNFLDMTPKGRNETSTMSWMRRHDQYEGAANHDCCS